MDLVPELPEVEALAAYLRERAVGRTVQRFEVSSFSALKTFDPPASAVAGRPVSSAGRHGKFLDIGLGDDLHLVVHLARAGWLHYRDSLPAAPPKLATPHTVLAADPPLISTAEPSAWYS